MQGLHHQQQQLAALLTTALPKDDSSKTGPTSSTSVAASSPPKEEESSRLAAIGSLHRAILYPHNSLLVTHSAPFLAQGFSQLLSDNTIDRYIGWSLQSLSIGDGSLELALESLNEFLNVGEIGAIERYALPILKACQELLEDDRTSPSLLPRLLGVLTLISLKFFRCFQPHFMDIVDLLIGWALIPDIADSDKLVIMDSFRQFQKHWVNNMQFSLGLLSKFLGDMDALLHDGSPGSPQQFKRLLALLSCFCTVLQSVASGLLEINFLEQISEPLSQMVPALLGCLSMVGRKFGWSKWIEDSWRCLTLLAEILSGSFSTFYPIAVDLLNQSLVTSPTVGTQKITSFQIHGVLKTNLQLLSLQKFGLMSSSVQKILQFDGPISQLRLHPNHLVTGSAAATYVFLLQHGKNDVVEITMDSLFQELQLLGCKLENNLCKQGDHEVMEVFNNYSKDELIMLIKFDLKVLLSCVTLGGCGNSTGQAKVDVLSVSRTEKLVSFLADKLDPFNSPIKGSIQLQATLLRTIGMLSAIEFFGKCSVEIQNGGLVYLEASSGKDGEEAVGDLYSKVVFGHLRRYNRLLIKALESSSPLAVKMEALKWMHKFCEDVINTHKKIKNPFYPCQPVEYWKIIQDLLYSTLIAASDREPEVRSLVATVIEMLLQAKIIHPIHFPVIAETILERVGDPEKHIKNAYLNLLCSVLPLTTFVCGLCDSGDINTCKPQSSASTNKSSLHWKQVFALKQLPQQFHSQQLVSVLSFISQRWKVPLSSWIQRLIHTCQSKKYQLLTHPEETQMFGGNGLWWEIKVEQDILERVCTVNLLAGAWWSIHEAARFCITTRLRTNLGGPTQTFAALERMLLDVSHVLHLETEQSDGSLNITGSYAHLLPMRLLLEFVEALKKQVYNAYEGSAILAHASRTSSLFFRSNKKVCEEWFSRISEPMMDAGLALQCHYATIHYCTMRLQDLSSLLASALAENSRIQISENLHNIRGRYAGDILRIMQSLALALCKNNEPDALVGLQKWATKVFSPLFSDGSQGPRVDISGGDFPWIEGLVYQARGQHEKAAAYYIHLLQTEESLASMGSNGVQFSIARIIENYTCISDWKSLESWLLELQTIRSKHAGRNFSGALTTAGNELNSIQALACFDEGNFQAAWSYLDLTPKSSNKITLDPKLALQRSEQMLLQAMLLQMEGKVDEVPLELQKARLMLEEPFSVLPLDGLVEAAPHVNQLYCISVFEEACNLEVSKSGPFNSLLSTYMQTLQFPCNQVHQECSLWLKVLRVYQNTLPNSLVTLQLCKNLVTLARKQRNLMLATRLNNYLKKHVSLCSDESFCDYFTSSMKYEDILLLRVENRLEDAFKDLWSFVHPLVTSSSHEACAHENVLKAKACLKLSNWLKENGLSKNLEGAILEMQSDLNKIGIASQGKEAATSADANQCSKIGMHLVIEELVGTARKLSTLICPRMGKSWILYASWCYTQASASVSSNCETVLCSCSFSPILNNEIKPERFVLTEGEQLHVKHIVLQLVQERLNAEELNEERGDCNNLINEFTQSDNEMNLLLQKIVDVIETAAGTPGAEDCSSNAISSWLSSELQKCLNYANMTLDETKSASAVADLIDVWRSLRWRRVSLFGQAAQAFINYLSFSSLKSFDGQLTGRDVDLKSKYVSYTLKAMLYVLHILVNYGVELKDTLESALSKAPLLPWQEITPQLFARLSSHPDEVVRKQLEALLIMLAKLSPWSLVYPTLVDANSPEKEPSEELQNILSFLNKLYPGLVQDAQLMIKELENVTVLWEELWLGTLQDLHADVMRRINLLKEEAARIEENITLTRAEKKKINAAKYSAMMAPIVVVLERRLTSTSRRPETPHELWFFEEYQEQIKSAVTKLKTPPVSVAALGDVWRPFEAIASSLASYQRKSSISFREVAPQLASLLNSNTPMPGLERKLMISESESSSNNFHPEIVTIGSFSEQLAILPTKTKPKKLVLVGSDGLKYTYLLKGREDLRLDARIMQLLQSVNGFLQSSSATRGQSLAIRYYSVTPISGRAGLIQWVDNMISIYSVFKSWQHRAQLQQLSATGADTNNVVHPPVPRPSDMFYGKIIPALKEKGIRRVISRRDWPHDVKRKVLLDLMSETPKQLLHQELWCSSEGFKAFSSKLKRFSGSVAVMSIVGHILGLGDRHLDNILVDFCTGDILHIDYNVCFDKGQRLKIPEIVPFRLTQMMESALGLTGTEGSFRANCEAVLGVLRKNKDIILMLLEVFVWDPLVEWTQANFHDDAAIVGEERKGMELAVSLSLFASRVQEIRFPLQEHHDLLLSTLPAVESTMERFTSILNQYETTSSYFYQTDQERSNLVQHEKSAKSVVAEATSNSEKSHALFEMQAREFSQAQTIVVEKGQEAAAWVERHGRILDALRNNSIREIKVRVELTGLGEALSLTSAVIGAGVPLTVVPEPTQIQCHEIDKEVSQLVFELDHGLSSAVSALQVYSLALQRVLPLNYLTTSPVHRWAQILLSLNTITPDVISVARIQGAELITSGPTYKSGSVKANYDDLCLNVTKFGADIERLEEEYGELVMSLGQETESNAKERILSAFTNHIKRADLKMKEGSAVSEPEKYEGMMNSTTNWELVEKKENFIRILDTAVSNMFHDVHHKINQSLEHFGEERNTNSGLQADLGSFLCVFEEQIEKCSLLMELLDELRHHAGLDTCDTEDDINHSYAYQGRWASIIRNNILFCKNLIGTITEVIPNLLRSVISFNSDVMDLFGSISEIRASVDTAIDQLVQVELEKFSLVELESNYFVKVGLITEQQLALEEASVKGRDCLSWEEAEELATQEEACRVQLDELHQTWNQKDLRTTSLTKREENINSTLVDSELHLQSLLTTEHEEDQHISRRKALLLALFGPFTELESVDEALVSMVEPLSYSSSRLPSLIESINSGCSVFEYIWKFPGLMRRRAFFIWKVLMVDLLLDSCTHDVATSFDQNIGFDQLVDVVKRKLRRQFQEHIGKYLKDRVVPSFLTRLDKEIKVLRQRTNPSKNIAADQVQSDFESTKRMQLMLEEYCNVHESFRAVKSRVSIMNRQINELKDALLKTSMEISQVEWMHNVTSRPLENVWQAIQKYLPNDDNLLRIILNTSRPKFLESLRTSVGKIARSVECLESCEGASVTAEAQLERAMSWACGGPNASSSGNFQARNSGIPPEFHDHLIKRQKMLQEARENATDIMKICISILEFEASRDGVFRTTGEVSAMRTGMDGGMWQQSYFNAITKLDVAYHSYSRAEKEWEFARSNVEAASSGLASAANELSIASVKANSASGEMQSTLIAMKDSAYEASVALSTYGGIVRGHSALTSECGSMLEEVLAITEDLHDIHNLGKEASALHSSLMEELSKANSILIPLESLLSKDVAAMTEAMPREKETKLEIAPIHGQAIFQSYQNRVKEALRVFKPLVPSLTYSVKGLYTVMTRLARAASLHAGNLHKALEGLGESLQVRSQDTDPSRGDLTGQVAEYDDTQESEIFIRSDGETDEDSVELNDPPLADNEWISPPLSISSSSSESSATSAEASIADSLNDHDVTLPVPSSTGSEEKDDCLGPLISHVTNPLESPLGETDPENNQETYDVHSVQKDGESVLTEDKTEDELQRGVFTNVESIGQPFVGKNPYAMSVLRRVEMKLDGRDISDKSEISIVEQVDFLLRQATNIDNLCNMYEGWTPWI
ncbi:uncharacterized protein LOC127262327 isoform X2 [Andrographis paniculata]|uniref:uncharacterized protein LOC127262327 isoform X2 n=1 Tax=Andrographis paniculata TaxID=175694 RepID=UPI0021E7D2E3|nr:uncharacterized protein LOC127262327 isoform X2 [Andrographis paniculata]